MERYGKLVERRFDERDSELFAKVIFKSDRCLLWQHNSEIGKGERLNERYVPSLTS